MRMDIQKRKPRVSEITALKIDKNRIVLYIYIYDLERKDKYKSSYNPTRPLEIRPNSMRNLTESLIRVAVKGYIVFQEFGSLGKELVYNRVFLISVN